ncbi:K(+)-transporting ATPase subunit C [Phytoactinopolyspora limicola]|uniref:K(+)-transporting ATPase subunit C n=1 Tax=Phytoactinopolyspora limicola TaxID=2715536 RepID=UPI0014075CF3|nr:K(+)-transporting ATPase subunit C [Phytoactinopolyspora limicola]
MRRLSIRLNGPWTGPLTAAVGMLLVFTLITGVVYPLAVTGVAQVAFNDQANGSLLERDGEVVGSRWMGQPFTSVEYFHSRPSAVEYDGSASGGHNLGPTNPVLLDEIDRLAGEYRQVNGLAADADVPVDAVTASASGLDPHISVANAVLQADRVAVERGVPVDEVLRLVDEHTSGRTLGFLGERGVNVLELNLTLDGLSSRS